MPDLEILGVDTHIPKGGAKPWLIIGGSALLLLFLFRRKGSGASPAASTSIPAGVSSQQLEFARLAQQAQSDMARLTSTNNLRLAELQYSDPGRYASEISFKAWDRLTKGVKDVLLRQIQGGELIVEPTSTGYRFIPTAQGVAGHQPPPPKPKKQTSIGVNIPGLGGGSISF